MKKLLPLFILLLCPLPSRAQTVPLDVKGEGVKTIVLVSKFPVVVSGAPGADLYFWTASNGVTFTDKGDAIDVLSAPQGESSVHCRMLFIDWSGKKVVSKFGVVTFSVGAIPPGPKPPDPIPPIPVPATGLKVLIVEEESARSQLPKGQKDIILGKDMRDWLIANCSPDPATTNGKGYDIWDKDVSTDNVPKAWADAMVRGRTLTMPGVVIMDGQGVILQAVPLPADPEALKLLLGKYLPPKRKAA